MRETQRWLSRWLVTASASRKHIQFQLSVCLLHRLASKPPLRRLEPVPQSPSPRMDSPNQVIVAPSPAWSLTPSSPSSQAPLPPAAPQREQRPSPHLHLLILLGSGRGGISSLEKPFLPAQVTLGPPAPGPAQTVALPALLLAASSLRAGPSVIPFGAQNSQHRTEHSGRTLTQHQ